MNETNLSRIGRQVCECQEDRHDYMKESMVEPKSRHHWDNKQEQAKPDGEWGWGFSGVPDHLTPPETDDGVAVIRENFPDANLVCPVCGEERVVVCLLMTPDEAEERREERERRQQEEARAPFEDYEPIRYS